MENTDGDTRVLWNRERGDDENWVATGFRITSDKGSLGSCNLLRTLEIIEEENRGENTL